MQISSEELKLIARHRPASRSGRSLMRAAVAIILRDGEQGTEFLLMQRTKHHQDPWSGQMAFPGGKIDPQDASAKAAAIREAREEVGLELGEDDYIGQLDDLYGLKVNNKYRVHVACFVFKPAKKLVPEGNYEVADLVWLPISYLDNPAHAYEYFHPKDTAQRMPAVLIDQDKEQILWGLSLRMLSMFYELIDRPLRVLSEQDSNLLRQIDKTNIVSSELAGPGQEVRHRRVENGRD